MTSLAYRPSFPPGTPVSVAVQLLRAQGFELVPIVRGFGIARRRKNPTPPQAA